MHDPTLIGVPILVTPQGSHMLERVPLTPEGLGAFDEAWLQRLIHNNPACLPIGEIEPGLDPFRAICQEVPTPRGPIDNLLMTGAGDIAIVEAKLFRNPEARRKVLAQTLDYATSLFRMRYEAFEQAVLGGIFVPGPKPASLYAALPEADKLEESAFVDTVSRNLRRGRALILIVGDGIRTEVEALLDGLHVHARFGFTLALVELGVFKMPEDGHYLIRPRTIGKTEIVQRTIIEVVGGSATVREERAVVPETLTSEAYWRSLEAEVPGARVALERLIGAAEPLGVYGDFLKTLNLKWQRPEHKPVNLGYFHTGVLWTDATASAAPKNLAREYVEQLALAFSCEARAMPGGNSWSLYKDGKPLRLKSVVSQIDAWLPVMQRFIAAVQRHDAETSSATAG